MAGMVFWFIIGHTSANVIVMWNGTEASIPSGWDCVSCDGAAGDPFNTLEGFGVSTTYPKIGNTFCGSDGETQCGGTNTHTHTYSVTSSQPSTTTTAQPDTPNGFNVASATHTHNSLNVSTTLSNTSLPLSYPLIFIRANDNNEDTLPAGAITFYNGTSVPSGFSMFTTADGYFILAGTNTTRNIIVGQATHNHTNHSLRTGNPSGLGVATAGTKFSIATTTHTHTLTSSIGWLDNNANHTPLYVDLPLIYAISDITFPMGMIAMFNDTTRTGNYSKLNESNWLGRYIRGNSTSFNTTGGQATHNHSSQNNLATGTGAGVAKNVGATVYPLSSHTHTVNITTGNKDNNPMYTNVTLFLVNGSVTVTPSDSCTYSGIGDWLVNCNDNCNITSSYSLPNNFLRLNGVGTFNLLANLDVRGIVKATYCKLVKLNSIKII